MDKVSMDKEIYTDVVVAGNGPVGMIAALALADLGLKTIIIGPKQANTDIRTTALMMPSIRMLEAIGVWNSIKPNAAPLKMMRILDGTDRLIRSRPVTFQASDIAEEAFGWNMPNMILNNALLQALMSQSNITRLETSVSSYEMAYRQTPGDGPEIAQRSHGNDAQSIRVTLETGTVLVSGLVVGADGRNSLARDAAGIKSTTWSYPQSALVTTFAHSRSHENCSTEFHTESGPFTTVPLPGNRSSLVWVLKPDTAADYHKLDSDGLSRLIETRMQSMLGKVTVSDDRQLYPLSGQYPSRFANDRIALAGEAAHLFPPIGAQGLNLGIRDVEDLCAIVGQDLSGLGSREQMAAYDAKRRPDIIARTGAVDALNRSLLTSFLPTQLIRSLGLATLDMVPPLRGFFMREGMRPGSGFTAMLTGLKKGARG
jgi:2-octaprenyl-6-methoxyphenol hydroxylase